MGKLMVVSGGQFGSEGKGAISAYLARHEDRELLAIRVAGPNAGHTVYDDHGQEFKLRCIPTAAVVNHGAQLAISAGSEIDELVLDAEIKTLEDAGHPIRERLSIDWQATVIEEKHQEQELGLVGRIGSTGKGIGAARADRIMREAVIWGDHEDNAKDTSLQSELWLKSGGAVLIEGTQGYGLGLHAGYYPQCTSSDCRAVDFLSMAGISPWADYVTVFEPWLVFRTHPIRVAGTSGPLLGETTWEALGVEPEHTTVTKKVRRVGQWDPLLVKRAIRANGGPEVTKIALTFLDYLIPQIHNSEKDRSFDMRYKWDSVIDMITKFEYDMECHIDLVGTGPDSIEDRRFERQSR